MVVRVVVVKADGVVCELEFRRVVGVPPRLLRLPLRSQLGLLLADLVLGLVHEVVDRGRCRARALVL